MTMYTRSGQGLQLVLRGVRPGVLAALVVLLSGCEVGWGGASVHLVNPAPEPLEEVPVEEEEVVLPLPAGPLLWVARSSGTGGEALAMPVARMEGGMPVPLEYPDPLPEGYRARFDSAFAVSGRELALGAAGSRIGTLLFSGPPRVLDARCPSALPATMLLAPGGRAPLMSFATRSPLGGDIAVAQSLEVDVRIRTFGPILAEQLLRAGGEARPFLAQRADLIAVTWPGDERPALAATYLINDALDADPPQGDAVSLFFLARFDPVVGYIAEWSEMRAYGDGDREVFTWLEAIPGPDGRIDFAIRHDGVTRRIVASAAGEGKTRGIDWTEGARCPSLALLEGAGG